MSKLGKLAVSIGLMLAAAVAGTAAYKRYQPFFASAPPKVSLACPIRYQLMTPLQSEWLVIHMPRGDCRDHELLVVHSNGELGSKRLRDNLTLESESIDSSPGVERRHVDYAADGKTIVSGFENWLDGTPALKIITDPQDGIVTTRWWPNSRIFSVEKEPLDGKPAEYWYYHSNGQAWIHYIGPAHPGGKNIALNVVLLEVWSQNGTPILKMVNSASEGKYTVYREDGTRNYEQTLYAPLNQYYRRLTLVNVYAGDGQRVVRELHGAPYGWYLNNITDIAEDGSKIDYDLQDWNQRGNVVTIRRYDNTGTLVESKPGNNTTLEYDRTMAVAPVLASPTPLWEDLVQTQIYGLPKK